MRRKRSTERILAMELQRTNKYLKNLSNISASLASLSETLSMEKDMFMDRKIDDDDVLDMNGADYTASEGSSPEIYEGRYDHV